MHRRSGKSKERKVRQRSGDRKDFRQKLQGGSGQSKGVHRQENPQGNRGQEREEAGQVCLRKIQGNDRSSEDQGPEEVYRKRMLQVLQGEDRSGEGWHQEAEQEDGKDLQESVHQKELRKESKGKIVLLAVLNCKTT